MSGPQFSRPGAVDLSSLRRPAPAGPRSGAPSGPAGTPIGQSAGSPGPAGTGGSAYVVEVTSEASLRQDVVERSLSVVVLVSFWSPESPPSVEITSTLTELSAEFAGRFLLATVDVTAHPELASALGIPEVPLVVAALRGQLAPLLQDPLPAAQMRALVEQILQAAVANGVSGRAEPVASSAAAAEEHAEPPPARYPAAEDALMRGDLDAAIAAYSEALRASPADEEATLGLAQASLLKRTTAVDPTAARAAAAERPDDVEAQTLAADVDLVDGQVEAAFSRLVELVRRTSGSDREAARRHLVELFRVVGDADPRVGRARSSLASALF